MIKGGLIRFSYSRDKGFLETTGKSEIMGKTAILEKINSLREDERDIIMNTMSGDDDLTTMTVLRLYVPEATYMDMALLHGLMGRRCP